MSSCRAINPTFVLSVTLLVTACGPSRAGQGAPVPGPRTNVLTSRDLAPYRDAMVAVRTLRRQWLAGRDALQQGRPAVFVDGVLAAGADALSQFPVHSIQKLSFLPATEAMIRFGGQFPHGAILVATTRGGARSE